MARNKIVIETYGIDPPQKSTLYWDDINGSAEDDIIDLIDFQASLQKLTSTERKILSLSTQGYSIREIEEMIGIPRATVQDTKDRAINKLRNMMNGEDSIHSVFA